MNGFKIARTIILLVGSGLLIGAWFLYSNTREFIATAMTVPGVVVDLKVSTSDDSSTYAPVFEFMTLDGESFTVISSAGSNPPAYSRGEAVQVFYQADDPYDAKIDGFFSLWGGAVIVGTLGAIFFCVGVAIVLVPLFSRRKHGRLRSTGRPVVTKVISLREDTSVTMSGRHPYRIVTQWQNPVTTKVHVFDSESLWFDPSEYMANRDITVYIDPNDPDDYWMDTTFLPELAD